MALIKNIIRRILGYLGYTIKKSDKIVPKEKKGVIIPSENYKQLLLAYEDLLNKSEQNLFLDQNKLRIKLLASMAGTQPPEAYSIIKSLLRTKAIIGDVCEFGVADGRTSALIANEISHSNKILHLFDSFKGLPPPTKFDILKDDIFSLGNIEAYTGKMSYSEEKVLERLRLISFPSNRYVVHKGFIEKIIKNDKQLPLLVSFAYVDFDFYEPITIALKFLHSVTPKGAIIIIDDYDWFSTGVKTAVDEFLQKTNLDQNSYKIFIPDKKVGHYIILTKKV